MGIYCWVPGIRGKSPFSALTQSNNTVFQLHRGGRQFLSGILRWEKEKASQELQWAWSLEDK